MKSDEFSERHEATRQGDLEDGVNPTLEQYGAFQDAFDFFNRELFDGKLPRVLLNFSRKNRQTNAFFASNQWGKNGQEVHEISINPNSMDRTDKEICASIVHELCHLQQEAFGKKKSRKG
jgi:predicted metal-dependent hydrolase